MITTFAPIHLEAHAEDHTGAPNNRPSNSMDLPSPEVQAVLERIRSGAVKASSTNPMLPPSQAIRATLEKLGLK